MAESEVSVTSDVSDVEHGAAELGPDDQSPTPASRPPAGFTSPAAPGYNLFLSPEPLAVVDLDDTPTRPTGGLSMEQSRAVPGATAAVAAVVAGTPTPTPSSHSKLFRENLENRTPPFDPERQTQTASASVRNAGAGASTKTTVASTDRPQRRLFDGSAERPAAHRTTLEQSLQDSELRPYLTNAIADPSSHDEAVTTCSNSNSSCNNSSVMSPVTRSLDCVGTGPPASVDSLRAVPVVGVHSPPRSLAVSRPPRRLSRANSSPANAAAAAASLHRVLPVDEEGEVLPLVRDDLVTKQRGGAWHSNGRSPGVLLTHSPRQSSFRYSAAVASDAINELHPTSNIVQRFREVRGQSVCQSTTLYCTLLYCTLLYYVTHCLHCTKLDSYF